MGRGSRSKEEKWGGIVKSEKPAEENEVRNTEDGREWRREPGVEIFSGLCVPGSFLQVF